MLKYLVIFSTFIFTVFASDFSKNPDFKNLENYLKNIKSIKGNFIQSFEAEQIRGMFALELPDALKMDYANEDLPVIIIVNPNIMTYYDKKLDQRSQIKTPKNASSLLLTPNLSLYDAKISIVEFQSNKDEISLEFLHSDLPKAKIKALFLKKETLILKTIEVIQNEEIIKTDFTNIVINPAFGKNEFKILNKKIDAKFNI